MTFQKYSVGGTWQVYLHDGDDQEFSLEAMPNHVMAVLVPVLSYDTFDLK
jgi:hypothetical protein